jgi:peptidoglycan/LPS O-acetylase OafA/YrhL
MQTKSSHAPRIYGLDLLRATAILMVLVTHSSNLLRPWFPWLSSTALFGYLGVELFFVLSGFLIGRILIRIFDTHERVTFSTLFHFWVRRWFRTLPNYYLVLTILVLMGTLLVLPVPDWRFFFFVQNMKSPHPSAFPEAWSLAVEEWFYLLMPLWFLTGSRLFAKVTPRIWLLGLTLSVMLASIGFRFFLACTESPAWDEGVRKVVIFRLDAIMTGVLWAWIQTWYPGFMHRHARILFGAGLALMTLSVAQFFMLDKDVSVYMKTLYFTLTSVGLSLLLPLCSTLPDPKTLRSRVVTHISLISYTIYLTHLSIVLVPIFGYIPMDSLGQAFVVFVLYWIVCLALPYPVYRWYEVPMMKLRDRFS